MPKLLVAPFVGLVLAAGPAEAQSIGSILNTVLGGGSSNYGYQPTYQQSYEPAYGYEQSYGNQPAYGYQQSYSYQPAYSYQQTYGYQPSYVYSQPRYVRYRRARAAYPRYRYSSYGYRASAAYSQPRYRYAAYRQHARRHHSRVYAYAGGYYR
jgi:hypothetical protein